MRRNPQNCTASADRILSPFGFLCLSAYDGMCHVLQGKKSHEVFPVHGATNPSSVLSPVFRPGPFTSYPNPRRIVTTPLMLPSRVIAGDPPSCFRASEFCHHTVNLHVTACVNDCSTAFSLGSHVKPMSLHKLSAIIPDTRTETAPRFFPCGASREQGCRGVYNIIIRVFDEILAAVCCGWWNDLL